MNSEPSAHSRKRLVLDANILVRAVLGRRVPDILAFYADQCDFLTPDVAYTEVQTHLPRILARRGLAPEDISQLLDREVFGRLPRMVVPVPHEAFDDLEEESRRRLARRDESDWPYVALALRLGCPVWTEDADFFGSGVATWTTDRVTIYLESNV